MKSIILTLSLSATIAFISNAQVFTGIDALKRYIEFEGQRFLMEEIIDVSSHRVDTLLIEKTITQLDDSEGFFFVLTSYSFNDTNGVILTSYNALNFSLSNFEFVNIHLSNEEYTKLYFLLESMGKNEIYANEHFLTKFSDRLTVEASVNPSFMIFTLWVDNSNRHSFSLEKWKRAYIKYLKFTGQVVD